MESDSAQREAEAVNQQLWEAYRGGRIKDARELAQRVVDICGPAAEGCLRAQLNYATYYLAHFCYLGGEVTDGLVLMRKLYGRWQAEVETETLALEAGYLLTLAQDLVGLREFDQARELYRLIGERLERASDPLLRQPRALALAGETGMLGRLGRVAEAQDREVRMAEQYGEDGLAAYDEQLARLDVAEPSFEQSRLRALALYNKAGILMILGRTEEAMVLFAAIVEQYGGDDQGDGVAALVAQARELLGER